MRSMNLKQPIALMLCMIMPTVMNAQNAAPEWIEEVLYSSGKFNTVAAVVGIIILGIGIWLFLQDRRLGALEERINRGKGTLDRS